MKTTILAAVLAAVPLAAWAEGQTHYVAVQVNTDDRQTQNMALNNVRNVISYYEEQGDEVVVEVVAYGPGLHMFRTDTSPVADRVAAMALEMDNVTFSACANTIRNMTQHQGVEPPLMEEAGVVPSGVVRLIELQEQGYAYVRP